MAQPSFVAAGAYLDGSAATAQVEVPAGAAAGMVAVVTMFMDGAALAVNPTPAPGFELAEGAPVQIPAGSGSHSLYVWWKRLTGADTGTYDFTWSESRYREAVATLYADVVATGSPFDSPTDTASDIANSTVTPPVDVTSLGPDRRLLWAGTCWAGGTWTAPTSFAMRAQGGAGLFAVCDRAWPTASNSGPVSGTCTGSDKRLAWLGALIGTTGGAPSVAVTGRSAIAATGSGSARKTAPATPRAGAAVLGAATGRKQAPASGVSSSALAASAGTGKNALAAGAAYATARAYQSQTSARAVTAGCSAAAIGAASARKALPVSGLAAAPVGAVAATGHAANAVGVAHALPLVATSASKWVAGAGRSEVLTAAIHQAAAEGGGAGTMSSRDRPASMAIGIARSGTLMASRPRRGTTMEGS